MQELWCHACSKYVQFNINRNLNGRHTIRCPNCGHAHYRYVNNGRIGDRWRSSGPVMTYRATNIRYSNSTCTAGSSDYIYNSWYDSTDSTSAW